jgi:RNA polymerase sigma factor (TIGR02999 family)
MPGGRGGTLSAPSSRDVTELLLAWNRGDQDALDRLIPLVHDELHRLAKRFMRREAPGQTLQTTALVNEVYLRLVDASRVGWQNRAHFFGIASRLMRQVLVDIARSRNALKRGGAARRVSLDQALELGEEQDVDLIALDQLLATLAALDERKGQVVELRFFGGLSVEETAVALGVSPETVMRDWKFAKTWLLRELNGGAPHGG